MIWKARIVIIIFAVLIAFSSCSKEEEPDFPEFESGEITGELLWKRIAEDYSYRDYAFWPGHEGVRAGQAPHGPFHRIYVNRTLLESLPISDSVAPYGSIIVKDNLNASRELDGVTVMAKVKGYNPDVGDWFWAKYAPDGAVQAEGKPGGCIGCHEGLKENDYVVVQMLDAPLRE
jgi:hypothetical protein